MGKKKGKDSDERTIRKNGQSVVCYGAWEEDSNVECVFENELFDGTWCEGANSWSEAIRILTAYAKEHDTVLVQATSC